MISSRSDHGGGPKHIACLLEGLGKRLEFFVAAPKEGIYADIFRGLSIKTFPIPHRRFSIRAFFELIIFVKSNGIDIVHSHGGGAGYYGRLLKIFLPRIKVVHTFHGFYFQRLQGIKKPVLIGVEIFLSSLTNAFIFVSPSEMEMAESVGLLYTKKSHLISNGIPFVPWKDLKPRNNPKKLITVTRLEPEKGNEILICLAKCLSLIRKDFVLSVVGDGPERLKLESLAETLGVRDHVQFLGYREDVPRLLADSDIFVSTSLGEAQGIAVIEAMIHGVPVVISRVLGHVDIVESGRTGYLFELDSPSEGSKRIDALLGDENLWEWIRKNAYKHAKDHFSLERMVKKTEYVYKSLICSCGGRIEKVS
ncbi:MAG: glycosyltransferase [Nitrospiraceae bacterium]|nr:glycosyltransferase [Nitrospiraceae bacterium]